MGTDVEIQYLKNANLKSYVTLITKYDIKLVKTLLMENTSCLHWCAGKCFYSVYNDAVAKGAKEIADMWKTSTIKALPTSGTITFEMLLGFEAKMVLSMAHETKSDNARFMAMLVNYAREKDDDKIQRLMQRKLSLIDDRMK